MADITAQADLPKSPSAFDADDRISFSREDNTFLLETEAGQEYQWDAALRRWIPTLDEAAIAQQRAAYTGQDDDEITAKDEIKEKNKKRKKGNKEEGDQQPPKKQRANTAIYVTNIPLDASASEINTVFSRYGLIAEEIDSGRPRIKMYTDDKDAFKGDALISFFRPESVQLAVQMLDDAEFRPGGNQGRMKVQEADFSYKAQKEVPDGPPSKNKGNQRDKAKIIKKTQKMNSKLADWDDDDPSAILETSSRWDKVVILKGMFSLKELEDDPAALLEIKEDIREECEKLGEVTNVQLFDKETEGVASVRFADARSAEACIRAMHGRWFDGAQVEASIATGKEKFKKSGKKAQEEEDQQEKDENERLDGFGKWLAEEKEKRGEGTKVENEPIHHTNIA